MFHVKHLLVTAGAALLPIAGCNRTLPEPQSPAARLYVARCGSCHAAYEPRSLTAAMWEMPRCS